MLYTSLHDLPLSRFIDMYNGNLLSLIISGDHPENDLKETSKSLITEYLEIVAGKSIRSELDKKDTLLVCSAIIEVLNACKNLIKVDNYEDVCAILAELGHPLNPDEKEKINTKVDSLLATSKFKLDRVKSSISSPTDQKINKDYFYEEISMVMAHYKMQIDKNSISAKEYAFLVKRMCEDIDRIRILSMKKGR